MFINQKKQLVKTLSQVLIISSCMFSILQAKQDELAQQYSCDLAKEYIEAVKQYCVFENGMYRKPKGAGFDNHCERLIEEAISPVQLARNSQLISIRMKKELIQAVEFLKKEQQETLKIVNTLKQRISSASRYENQDDKDALKRDLEIKEIRAEEIKGKIELAQQRMKACGVNAR